MECAEFTAGDTDIGNGKIVLVFINHDQENKRIILDGIKLENAFMYVTDKDRNLGKSEIQSNKLIIPQRSVSTLVVKGL